MCLRKDIDLEEEFYVVVVTLPVLLHEIIEIGELVVKGEPISACVFLMIDLIISCILDSFAKNRIDILLPLFEGWLLILVSSESHFFVNSLNSLFLITENVRSMVFREILVNDYELVHRPFH